MSTLLVQDRGSSYLVIQDEDGQDDVLVLEARGSANLTVMDAGIQGPPGPSGGFVEVQAAVSLLAGQAVRPNVSGQLVLAQADTLNNSKQVALAMSDTAPGFSCPIRKDFLVLTDWTSSTGDPELVSGADYFLSSTTPGALTTVPPASGVVLFVGTAVSPTTLAISLGLPVLL